MGTTFKKIGIRLLVLVMLPLGLAHASPENDRVYQLESLGFLRSTDNADGVFGDYLEEQYSKFFSRQSRFVIKKIKGIDDLIKGTSAQKSEFLKQPEILKKISQKFKVENLLRSRVYKEGDSYRFVLEWVYAPKGDVLSQVEFRYIDQRKDEGLEKSDLPIAVEKGLDELLHKLPFLGQITGIDKETVTVNLGRDQNLKPRDILTIYTLQSLRRHPLLNTIEEWRWQAVGRVQVEQVEDSISFAKIIETEPGQNMIRLQKVREIVAAPAEVKNDKNDSHEKDIPRIGWLAGNVGLGNYSRDVGIGNNTSGRTGGGMAEFFEVETQVWMNSRFIVEASLQGNLYKYTPKDLVTNAELAGNYSGTGSQFRLAGGYSLFPMKTVYDPMAWVHAGYKATSYSLPTGTADYTADSTFSALFIGVGGSLPINEDYGAQMGIDLGLLRGADAVNLGFGSASSSTDISFTVGGTYHFQEQIFLRLLLKLNSQSMDFIGGQTVSQKMFLISPSIMYYF